MLTWDYQVYTYIVALLDYYFLLSFSWPFKENIERLFHQDCESTNSKTLMLIIISLVDVSKESHNLQKKMGKGWVSMFKNEKINLNKCMCWNCDKQMFEFHH
jgi:hypothetical protein